MSQFSQVSQISDIMSDVDGFIEENGISEDVDNLMTGTTGSQKEDCESISGVGCNKITVKTERKLSQSAEFYGHPDYSPPSHCVLQFPPEQPVNLSTEEYSGPYDFNIFIAANEVKSPWEYSEKLKKLYIGINLKFPIEFRLKNRPKNVNLYVRATPIFSQFQHFQEIVSRCVGHQLVDDPSNKDVPRHIHQHIMRGTNQNIRYFGDKNDGTRLNNVVPLAKPYTDSNTVKEFYQFVCKNSCPMGMSRKPIDVVFTLENDTGKIFGRRLLAVRVCSCPKRDREKEEKDCVKSGKKRTWQSVAEERNDEVLNVDTRIFPMIVNIPGKDNCLRTLNICRDRMAAEMMKYQDRDHIIKPFKRAYIELSRLIDEASTKE